MECISISFQSVPAGIRQRFMFDVRKRERFAGRVMKTGLVKQCVPLSTCNRTEIYVQGAFSCFGELEKQLAEESGIPQEEVRTLVMRYQGKKSAEHLFRVAAGMDSMVIGEDEILGQVRDAYTAAAEAGRTGYELNAVFQAALSCAKRIKTQTKLSKTSVSIATLAAAEVFRLPVEPKTVLLIGSSGQTGGTILKNILSRENIRVIVTSRSHRGIYQDVTGRVLNVGYKERYEWLEEADAVISATSSPHYTITAGRAGEAMRTRKERLFLDVAVPADIDEKISLMDGCRLIGIDDFQRLAGKNNELKHQAVLDAQEILSEELDELYKSLRFHEAAAKLPGWKEKFADYTFEKLLFYLRDGLDSDSLDAVLKALDRGISNT